ncbi:MAG: hypothetical protein CM1200mP35_00880 [Chloroflexota bacterium]|nr:MAG: hypothetical protein CM1200mP35_00880 [Chloroflexota bacterium]
MGAVGEDVTTQSDGEISEPLFRKYILVDQMVGKITSALESAELRTTLLSYLPVIMVTY